MAFSLLTCAAFAWSLPWLDRPGTAALGFAFAALALSPGVPRAWRPARTEPDELTALLSNVTNDATRDLAQRIGAYSGSQNE